MSVIERDPNRRQRSSDQTDAPTHGSRSANAETTSHDRSPTFAGSQPQDGSAPPTLIRPRSHQHGRCITMPREKPARHKNDGACSWYCYLQHTGSLPSPLSERPLGVRHRLWIRHTAETMCPPSPKQAQLPGPAQGRCDQLPPEPRRVPARISRERSRPSRSLTQTDDHEARRSAHDDTFVAGPCSPTPPAPRVALGEHQPPRQTQPCGHVRSAAWAAARSSPEGPSPYARASTEAVEKPIARVFTRTARVPGVATKVASPPCGEVTSEVERR